MNNSHILKCHRGKLNELTLLIEFVETNCEETNIERIKSPMGYVWYFVSSFREKYVSNVFFTQLLLLLRFKFHNCYANVFALKATETLCRNDKIMSTKRGGSPKKLDKRL